MMTTAILVVAALALADALLTDRALRRGLIEANPILRRLLGAHPPLAWSIAWRAVVIAGLVWLAMPAIGWWVLAGLQLASVAWNLQKLGGLR